jgi:tetratricopeptide (TPR) repeat protein/predicted AlkP superfamily phosphohydrolase/phosphomutase
MKEQSSRRWPRLLVMGLRSVDWQSLHPHLDAGRMPRLSALIERGAIATLSSGRPLVREALWTSIATGLLADRHGVLSRHEIRPDFGGLQPMGRRSWLAPAFWELLEAEGIATATVNWPATAAADRWPGIHVDETFAVPSGAGFADWPLPTHGLSPSSLRDELAELRVHPADALEPEVAALAPRIGQAAAAKDKRLLELVTIVAVNATVHAAATHIAAKPEWDVLSVCYDLPHMVKLAFGKPDPLFDGVIERAHVLLDMMIGRLIDLAGPDAAVMVVSPNGVLRLMTGAVSGHPRGILIATGPDFAPDSIMSGADAVDIAPTILARYGLASPTDGRPLQRPVPTVRPARPWQRHEAPADAKDPTEALVAEGYVDSLPKEQAEAVRQATAVRNLHLGITLISRGRYDQAARALELALNLKPDWPEALRRLAQCRALLGDYAGCRAPAEALLAADPEQPWGHLIMATSLTLGGDSEAAKPYVENARRLGAEVPGVLIRLGGLALNRGATKEALELFRETLRLEPDRPDGLYGLGAALADQGDLAAAEHALRKAVQTQHRMPFAHQRLGMALAAQGRWREAMAALETAQAQKPDLPEITAQIEQARKALAYPTA